MSFSSRWKWSALRLESAPEWLVLGAPDVLTANGAHDVIGERQAAGRRVLVFGTAPSAEQPSGDGTRPPDLRPLAAVVLSERLREDTRATVEYLQSQGVALKVMSGDSPVTVAAIAGDAGIDVDRRRGRGRRAARRRTPALRLAGRLPQRVRPPRTARQAAAGGGAAQPRAPTSP